MPKLKDRLFVTILLVCLVPILLVSFVFHKAASHAVFDQYEGSIEEHLKQSDERFSMFLQLVGSNVEQMANDPAVRLTEGKLPHFSQAPVPLASLSKETERALNSLRNYWAVQKHIIKNVHIVTKEGGYASLHHQPEFTRMDPRRWRVYREILNGDQGPSLVEQIDPEISMPSVYMARRIANPNGQPCGLLLVEIDWNQVRAQFTSNTDSDTVSFLVLSKGKRVLMHSDPEKIGKDLQEFGHHQIFSRIGQGNDKVFTYMSDTGLLYVYQHISPLTGYIYAAILPEQTVNSHLQRLETILALVTLLVIALSAYMAHRISNWISQPVSMLVAATDALRQGDFSTRVPIHDIEEIQQLEKQFNEMAGQLQELLSRERDYLKKELDQIVRSFYLAVEMKDPYTAGHTERVTRYALMIYDCLQEKPTDFTRDDLRYAGLMHDIGKVAVPDRVLLKEGKLTAEEYELIKLHASMGADIVEQIESLSHVSPGVRHHHERWDGKGYPAGLRGEAIPRMGRILAIADTFDAMTSTRSYRKAMTAEAARDEIVRCAGTQFDPSLVEVFCQAYDNGLFTKTVAVEEVAAGTG